MIKRVSVLGCGWLGMPLAEKLKVNGYEVLGSTTSHLKTKDIKNMGVIPFVIDVGSLNIQSLKLFLDADVLIIAITSKELAAYEKLITFIEESTITKVVFISSTSVYSDLNRIVVEGDEDETKPLVHIEKLFQKNTNFNTTILRFGGLFGYDRQPGKWFVNRKIPQPKGFVNMIHQDDCVAIIESVLRRNSCNETFNACATDHPTREQFYTNARKVLGKEFPEFDASQELKYKIVSSDKLINALNYKFIHNDLLII